MAIFDFAPAIERSRKAVTTGTTKAVLRLVPELQSGKKANDKSFIIITSSVFIAGLFSLLLINTALAQDAFKLQQLKAQATTLADQREAILKEVSEKSSPAKLAENAMKLGMIVNTNPRFLDLTGGGLKP
jgi:cell division protein FtsL